MSIIVKAKYKKGLFAKKISVDSFMECLEKVNTENNYMANLYRYSDHQFAMNVCPKGSIHFEVSDNLLEISSQTSLAGPGFHKCVIDIINELGKKMNIHFDISDPTDYSETKAFAQLQKEHVKDLLDLFANLVHEREENPSDASEYIGWDQPWYPTEQYEFVTSFGSFSLVQIKNILNNDFEEFAKSQFVWFDEGKTASFYKQIALYHLWNSYKWRKAISKEEANISMQIVRSLEMARMADNFIELPSQVWQHICAYSGTPYLNMNEYADMDDTQIGYLKHPVHFLFPMDYGLKLAGTFERSIDQDGAVVLADLGHTVKVKVVPEMVPGQIMDPRKMMETIDYQDEIDGSIYIAQFLKEMTQHGPLNILHGYIQSYASYAEVTILYQDDNEKDWALSIMKEIVIPYSQPISIAMLG